MEDKQPHRKTLYFILAIAALVAAVAFYVFYLMPTLSLSPAGAQSQYSSGTGASNQTPRAPLGNAIPQNAPSGARPAPPNSSASGPLNGTAPPAGNFTPGAAPSAP